MIKLNSGDMCSRYIVGSSEKEMRSHSQFLTSAEATKVLSVFRNSHNKYVTSNITKKRTTNNLKPIVIGATEMYPICFVPRVTLAQPSTTTRLAGWPTCNCGHSTASSHKGRTGWGGGGEYVKITEGKTVEKSAWRINQISVFARRISSK
jgi:hypothetical protein